MKVSKFQFFIALLVAALWSDVWDCSTWKRAWALLTVWFADHGKQADHRLYEKRMAVCRSCPIFYDKLQTCGTPLTDELKGLGCYCHMPTAAKLQSKECWVDEMTRGREDVEYGWRTNGL